MRLTIIIVFIVAGLIAGIACSGTAEVEQLPASPSTSQPTPAEPAIADTAVPTETPIPPIETTVPKTVTPIPTATPVPPTATSIPKTSTPIPTVTPVPPTSTPKPTATPRPTATTRPTPISSAYDRILDVSLSFADKGLELEEEDTKIVALMRAGRVDGSERCRTLGAVYNHTIEWAEYLDENIADNVDSLDAQELSILLDIQDFVYGLVETLNTDYFFVLIDCGITLR